MKGAFDVLLLDLTLPQMDGLEVCKIIKQKKSIPIIITSARGGVSDKVVGLEMGQMIIYQNRLTLESL